MRHESLIEKEFGKTIYDLEKISKLIKKVFKEFKISSKSRKFKNLLKELKFEHNDIDYKYTFNPSKNGKSHRNLVQEYIFVGH